MDAGMAAAVKTAKTVTENGQDASTFLQWVANPCGSSNYTQMIDKIFDPLSNVPDSVMPGLGCKKKPCPGPNPKESGSKGDPDESAPATKASDTAKPTSDAATTASKASSTNAASTTSKPSDSASAGPSKGSSTAASTSGPTLQTSSSGSPSSSGDTSIPGSTVAPTTTIVPTTTESPKVETNSGACTAEPDATAPASGVDKRASNQFCFKYMGVPPVPTNSIPDSMACVNKLGQVTHYSSSMSSAAIQ